MDINEIHDKISTEIDRRKIDKLIEDGVITQEEYDNATIIDKTGDSN